MTENTNTRTYTRSECVVFCKTNEPFGGLSNMAAGFPLVVGGVQIRTSEALYQACRYPQHQDIQRLIIDQASPMTAKMKSRLHYAESRADWNAVRVDIMRWCLRVKLVQNPKLFGALLLETTKRPTVEESRRDRYWGAVATDPDTLVGMNVLGGLLMDLRQNLLRDAEWGSRVVEPLRIPNFLLLGEAIGTVAGAGAVAGTTAAPQAQPCASIQLALDPALLPREQSRSRPPTKRHR